MYDEEEMPDEHHEKVYGFMLKKTSKRKIEQQIQKALENSVAEVGKMKKDQNASSDSDFDWDPAADVAAAANRKQRTEKYTRQVTKSFGCHKCLCVVSASASEPKKLCALVDTWHGWSDPMSGPDKWEEIRLECENCTAETAAREQAEQLELEKEIEECEHWEKERAKEVRKRAAEQNKQRAQVQSKRLKKYTSEDDVEDFIAKLRKLKVPQLSEACHANAVLKSGKKDQLIERLVGVYRYGSLGQCPLCRNKLLELQHKGSRTAPYSVRCKYMKGAGRQCRFSKDLVQGSERDVLQVPLRDTSAGDLASVGFACS